MVKICNDCVREKVWLNKAKSKEVAELTEKELLSELIKEIKVMRADLSTVRQIIVFWFIIGLIGFVLSIISVLALL